MNHQEGSVNWGEGNRRQVDPIDLKWGSYPTYIPCSHLADIPEVIHRCLGTIDDPNEAINGEPQQVATGATAAPTGRL